MRLASICFVAALAGCAQQPVQWTKADLDPKALARDQEECEAYARAGRLKAKPARSLGLGPTGGFPSPDQSPDSNMERFQAEQELRGECMTQRGYRRQ